MSLIIDGVFFQLAQSGIARVWKALLPRLVTRLDMPIVLLDRGGANLSIEGIEVVPFPTYKSNKFNAGDSDLLERVCRHYDAKAFMSTYYSTPMETPSVLLVYDMIPEVLGFDLSAREWKEKELAISHARRHLCISANTRKDLLALYPELDPNLATVAYCGIDVDTFRGRDAAAVDAFRRKHALNRPYFMFVGSRVQANNYKNASLFFDALSAMPRLDFDVLCIGGERERPIVSGAAADARILQLSLSDEDLALAYAGAAALVYPSLYEGFGLPVAEAMSCGCPVICTSAGSLAEVAGDATLRVSGKSKDEMILAMTEVRNPTVRDRLIAAGREQSARFRWEPFADQVARAVDVTATEAAQGAYREFYAGWKQLRELQAAVDAVL